MRFANRWIVLAALIAVMALAMPGIASAATFRGGDSVVIAADERIDDDLYVSAGQVTVLGVVTGDVVASGATVDIAGNVGDDVMAAGSSVRISGDVGGSVRAAGGDVSITGRVAEDALAAGGNVSMSAQSSVERDVMLAGGAVMLGGEVARDAILNGGTVGISGTIGRNASVDAEDFSLAAGSTVAGDLKYIVTGSAELNGTVNGRTVRQEPPADRKKPESDGSGAGFLIFLGFIYWLRALIGYLIFGLIAVLVFKRFTASSTDALQARPWPSLGWGALVAFAFPFAFVPAFVIGLVIGGWWIAILALAAWFTLMAFGLVVGATWIGRLIVSRGEHKPHDVWPFLLGLALLWIVWLVPFIGGTVVVVAMIMGTGAILLAIAERRQLRSGEPDVIVPAPAAPSAEPPTSPNEPPIAPHEPPMAPMADEEEST